MPKTSEFRVTLLNKAKEDSPIVSIRDFEKWFPELSYDNYKTTLQRMQKKGEIMQVWRGVYLVEPQKYFGESDVHLREFLDVVMQNMNKDYYVSLRGAMLEHVPSFPQTEYYDIIVERSGLNGVIGSTIPSAYFVNSANIPSPYIINKETQFGSIRLATQELLAIDMMTYLDATGGLQSSVDALKLLSSKLNFRRLKDDIFEYRTAANIQRLGYIIENVLGMPAKAQPLHDLLDKRYDKVYARNLLASALPKSGNIDKRWQLDINIDLKG